MSESQNIEWKESWRDEYLKWICGFANAQGGRIYIGTDDRGTVIGVTDCKKLLEDIPNKVRDILGIIVDVNLLIQDGKDSIIFWDEPEISMHIDWQRALIRVAREINPFGQLIIATHSPSIIYEGWEKRIVNMEDLLKE